MKKAGTIVETFDIQDDYSGFRISGKELDVVSASENCFIAGADDGAESKSPAFNGEEVLGSKCATLGDKSDRPLWGEVRHGGKVEFEGGAADADAVGADEVEVVALGDGFDFFFGDLAVGSDFAVAGGDEDDVFDLGLGALVKDFGDSGFGYDDGGNIGCGAVQDAGIGFVAMNIVSVGVDGVDIAFVATGADVEGDERSHLGDVGRSADDGDGFRVQ